MKRIFLAVIITLTACTVYAQANFELSATEVASRMGIGWNLGNTLEAGNNANNFTNKGGLGAETSWQGTRCTPELFEFVRQQGFQSVRIPCAWVMGHISNASTYEIDSRWMARVKEIVDMALNADLYVIINQHWDGGWLERNITATGEAKEKNKAVLEAIWKQIANTFKDYDERLLFAGLNEPEANTLEATLQLKEYESIFINTVRATGGNNEKRVLIVQGPTTNIDNTNAYYGEMPYDPTATDRLMMEVHYYNPWQFWGMEKDESWGNVFYYWGVGNHVSGSKHNATCGEESTMREQLDLMKAQFVDAGIPVLIGEFGANWRNVSGQQGESQEKHDASIKLHYKLLVQYALERGMVPMMWDTNYCGRPSMTIINRSNLTIYNHHMMDGIKEAMATGIKETYADSNHPSGKYDLQGRRLTDGHLHNGIVIEDGKKFIVNGSEALK